MPHDLTRLGAWRELPFFDVQWPGIEARLATDLKGSLPPDPLRFAALERAQPDAVRVILLGQDPYPTPGHANGLAFSVTKDTALPKSLLNIFRELEDDLGQTPQNGDLSHWADQGVLLLNTALSVSPGDAGGHSSLGWRVLVDQVLRRLADRPRACLLWGRHAQAYREVLTNPGNLILSSAHPSPLSAYRGFFGSRPFSKVNAWLEAQGDLPVAWA
ncbi:MAG: uracil-DNA glycosylase [Paracoccaceae bacterium]|nr:uracil-DNA glycosylase [Paracoccaceae bacterium]